MADTIRTDMWLALADSPYVMVSLNRNADQSEPMRVQLDKDADHCFWFYTDKDNRVASGGKATITFSGQDHKLFASFVGQLVREEDERVIDQHWSNQVSAWFEDGRKDATMRMLRFDIEEAEIWTVDPTIAGRVKLATGATVEPEEMGDHATVSYA